MRINPNETILGIPMLTIRELLRRNRSSYNAFEVRYLIPKFNFTHQEATRLIEEIVELRYIEIDSTSGGQDNYINTIEGNAFANASAARPIKRTTADLRLKEFTDRIPLVNNDLHFQYKVTQVDIFGSYLTEKKTISDIDLIIHLEQKDEMDRLIPLRPDRYGISYIIGPKYDSNGERLYGFEDVLKFLKSRKRSISMHLPENVDKSIKRKTVFP